jgi:anthranilate phosphoribosyltransferase
MSDALKALAERRDLTPEQADSLFGAMLDGQLPPATLGAALMGLRAKGETAIEVAAAARAMRARMRPVAIDVDAVDCCGTGGDGLHTLNISTAAAILVAACGVPVAKHGNRAASSQTGSTDVLAELGVSFSDDPALLADQLHRIGITYFPAPSFHPALGAIMPTRRELGFRTLFNLLGPLCNPAGVKRQLIGVTSPAFTSLLADVLSALGSTAAWVVHGAGGLDELSTLGPNQVSVLGKGTMTLDPAELGLPRATLEAIRGGDAAYNAAAIRALLDGTPSAYADIVLLNAAAVLHVATDAPLGEGLARARQALSSGAAKAKLNDWIAG